MKFKCPYCKSIHDRERWESNSKWEQEWNKEKAKVILSNNNKPVRCPSCNTRVLIGELIRSTTR